MPARGQADTGAKSGKHRVSHFLLGYKPKRIFSRKAGTKKKKKKISTHIHFQTLAVYIQMEINVLQKPSDTCFMIPGACSRCLSAGALTLDSFFAVLSSSTDLVF